MDGLIGVRQLALNKYYVDYDLCVIRKLSDLGMPHAFMVKLSALGEMTLSSSIY